MKPLVSLYKLGRLPYVKALKVQQILFDKLKANVVSQLVNPRIHDSNIIDVESETYGEESDGYRNSSEHNHNNNHNDVHFGTRKNSLILVEHEPVYTVGIRTKQYNDNYVSRLKEVLNEHKLRADFVKTNRGGLVTFHGPGQLVAYPIIYLGDFKKKIPNKSVKTYVSVLEDTIIDSLAMVGIRGAQTVKQYPGVWLAGGERKVAFIGISCKRYVTMHGISINCDCDLSWFDHIVSCGIEDKQITSIRQELLAKPLQQQQQQNELQLQPRISSKEDSQSNPLADKCEQTDGSLMDQITSAFCLSFSQHFDCKLIDIQSNPKIE